MSRIWSTARHSLRRVLRTPLFAATSVVTLALGIGATVAIFSVLHGVLMKPLSYDRPETLVGLWNEAPGLGFDQLNQTAALYFTYREEAKTLETLGLWDNTTLTITGLGEPEEVDGMMVTHEVLPMLGVRPVVGRLFGAADDQPEADGTVILGHEYWQRAFGGAADVVGRTLRVSGRPREILGVLPAGFRLLRHQPAVYYPARFDRSEVMMGQFNYQGIGRLAPGATAEQAKAELDALVPVATEKFPRGVSLKMLREARFATLVHPLSRDLVGDIGNVLWVLFGTVGFVLLIACANVANLFLVRAEGRRREIALRTAIGAGRGHLVRQFLGESLLLALLGGLGGVALAWAGLELLIRIGPSSLPRLWEVGLSTPVLLFALALSLLSGLAFGMLPVLGLKTRELVGSLKEGGRGSSEGRERHLLRNVLVASQVALALVLLIGAGLMMRSFSELRSVDPGFTDPEQVFTFRLSLPSAEVEDEALESVRRQILDGLASLPGVSSASFVTSMPMDGNDSNDPVFVEGFPVEEGTLPPVRRYKFAYGDHFETLGRTVLAGRGLERADADERRRVAVITRDMALEYWQSPAEALGNRLGVTFPGEEPSWREIVGVVGDVHDDGVAQGTVATVYWPASMEDFWGAELWVPRWGSFALRTDRSDASALLAEAQRVVWSVNPNLPLADPRTLDDIYQRSLARTSFTLTLLGIASLVALALGLIGIYGVITYIVSQRTREIGVRMALGARRIDVGTMIVRYGAGISLVGVVVGLLGAVGLTRWMQQLLYGVEATDPSTFVVVSALLVTVSVLASVLAARRAARVDPLVALRAD